jgi:pimeloyl-ACP methyl ester carboxylesterase
VLILLGDTDKMVTAEETQEAHSRLKNSKLEILPATPHPIEQANPAALAQITLEFLAR